MIESRGLISTREGFSIGLLRAGVKYPTIVGIGSDITASVGLWINLLRLIPTDFIL
jgi:hypothetical protein